MTATVRAPELRPAALAGRGVAFARQWRVRVAPQGLVLQAPGASERVLAPPGTVTRALWLDPDATGRLLGRRRREGGALVLLAADRPVLVLRLFEVAPPGRASVDDLRTTTGATGLVRALGLPIEPAEAADLAALDRGAVRDATVSPRPSQPLSTPVSVALLLLSLVLGFAALAAAGTAAGAVLSLLATASTLPVALAHHRGRTQATAGLLGPLSSDGRVVVRPVADGPVRRWQHESELQVGAEDVVLRERFQELWLPGPARGGVVAVTVSPDAVRLLDAEGRSLAVLRSSLWCATEQARTALADACRTVGLDVVEVPFAAAIPDAGQHVDALDDVPATRMISDEERGDLPHSLTFQLGFATTVVAVAAVAQVPGVLGLLAAAAGLVPLGVVVRHGWARRGVDRRARQLVGPQ